jgi:hypothetical protein
VCDHKISANASEVQTYMLCYNIILHNLSHVILLVSVRSTTTSSYFKFLQNSLQQKPWIGYKVRFWACTHFKYVCGCKVKYKQTVLYPDVEGGLVPSSRQLSVLLEG